MADDGMLINFDLGTGPFKTRSTALRGGSWKDKLTAKKAALYNLAKAEKKKLGDKDSVSDPSLLPSRQGRNQSSEGPRPVKKLKTSDNAEVETEKDTADSRIEGGQRGKHGSSRSGINHSTRATLTSKRDEFQRSDRTASAQNSQRQVVSSLFSFNPAPVSAKAAQDSAEPQADSRTAPSNAPLQSELDTFTSLGLSSRLAEHLLTKMGIKAPTSIQREAITQLTREDADAFIQAETGSGKTLAYLLPIVQRIAALSSLEKQQIGRDSGLFAIVLAPTRELSKQISVVLENLLRCMHWIVSGIVTGGESKKSEKARLRKGCNILIATPGRLADHLDNTKVLDVSKVRWLVLDEGDRLMELGFEQEVQKIVSTLNTRQSRSITVVGLQEKRTTVLCSATMKMDVQKLGEISLKDAVHLRASPSDAAKNGENGLDDRFSAPAQLQQSYAVVPAKLRLVSLQALLKRSFARKGSVMKTIVFMTCADSVDFHFEIFARTSDAKPSDDNTENGTKKGPVAEPAFRTGAVSEQISSKDCTVQIFRLHGSLPQAIRTSTLSAYTRCKDPAVLVCTDVASRGLDVPHVDFVVEYDPPFNKDDHLHRIGRTARAGNDGRAMIFLMPGSEESYVEILNNERHNGGRDVVQHDSADILKKGFGSAGLGAGRDWEDRATDWQLEVERWVLENPPQLEQARKAYQSHIRAYATHVAAERHMFDMTALHLGHLAKAFALRDKPGSIRVPGLRPSKPSADKRKGAKRTVSSGHDGVYTHHGRDKVGPEDTPDAVKRMRQKIKAAAQGGASEFNIG